MIVFIFYLMCEVELFILPKIKHTSGNQFNFFFTFKDHKITLQKQTNIVISTIEINFPSLDSKSIWYTFK